MVGPKKTKYNTFYGSPGSRFGAIALLSKFKVSFSIESVSWYWIGRSDWKKKNLKSKITRSLGIGGPGIPEVSRAGLKGATKVFNHGRKSPWVPTLTGPFPNGQENAGSWLGTKNALYYCAQSANSISWVLFVSSYTTAIDSITACLAHAPKKCTQSGIFQLDINATFQNTGGLYTRA